MKILLIICAAIVSMLCMFLVWGIGVSFVENDIKYMNPANWLPLGKVFVLFLALLFAIFISIVVEMYFDERNVK